MTSSSKSPITQAVHQGDEALLDEWLMAQQGASTRRRDAISDADLRASSRAFLDGLKSATRDGVSDDIEQVEWQAVRDHLDDLSSAWARLGLTPSETATFVLSFKQPLFNRLRAALAQLPDELGEALWQATTMIDKLGLYTAEVYLRSRQEIISRQHEEMLELSTPVVQLWEGILVLPLIGSLDSKRTQSVMENLLQRIVETGSEIAIVDITGVPTVDTLTAQHLLKTITATRLMGAECIISGIRPQIAQTMVHLGVDLGNVMTRASMAGALKLALERRDLAIVRKVTPRPNVT